jgi:hypothetical protein
MGAYRWPRAVTDNALGMFESDALRAATIRLAVLLETSIMSNAEVTLLRAVKQYLF